MATKYGKKESGGRYRKQRKKKLSERKGKRLPVIIGKEKKKKIKTRVGYKSILLRADKANVIDSKSHRAQVVAIKKVLEVPSNAFLARKNVLVKGAVIETMLGKARITNKPNQDGCVQAVLIS